MDRLIAVTGASGGIGRAVARGIRSTGRPTGADGQRGARADCRGRGRRPTGRNRGDVRPGRVRRRGRRQDGRPDRGRAGPDRCLGERRLQLGLRPLHRDRARRVPASHRSQLPRLRLLHHGGAAADEDSAVEERSSRSAPRWPTAASRCSRRTAARSMPSRDSTSRCGPSCCTSAARCTSRWCRCRR